MTYTEGRLQKRVVQQKAKSAVGTTTMESTLKLGFTRCTRSDDFNNPNTRVAALFLSILSHNLVASPAVIDSCIEKRLCENLTSIYLKYTTQQIVGEMTTQAQ